MNIGYYFHTYAVFGADGTAKTEAHWALFIRAVAAEAGSVTYYAHSGPGQGIENMELGPEWNVRCVDLGPRRRRPLMFLFPWIPLRNFKPKADKLDAMIVRGPNALLAPIAKRSRRAGVPMVGLLVDELTSNWKGRAGMPAWRVKAVRVWLWVQSRAITRVGRRSLMLAISKSIVRDPNFKRTAIVRTTSLSRADLTGPAGRTRKWPAPGEPIRLLFTGRVQKEKGLFELLDAVAALVGEGRNVELELAGPTYGDPTIDLLRARADELGIGGRVTYLGFLEAGPELLGAYLNADIFVSPTWGEGSVSRTIKEAFATGLPVVTTTVREIAEFLSDGAEAVLVPRQDAPALTAGIARMIDDPALRERTTQAGFEWVQDFTNEASAAVIVGHVRDEIARGVR